jgi:hypothetical protein
MGSSALLSISKPIDSFQRQIRDTSVSELLKSISPNIDSWLTEENLQRLYAEAVSLASPQRALALAILICKRDQRNQASRLQLLQACMRAGRFQDVLQLQATLCPDHSEALLLALISHYRLGAWQQVINLASCLETHQLAFPQQRLIIRSALELGNTQYAEKLLQLVRPDSALERQQARFLQLLTGFLRGVASPAVVEETISVLPQLDQVESACLLRFWPLLVLQRPASTKLAWLERWYHKAWRQLSEPRILGVAAKAIADQADAKQARTMALVMQSPSPEALDLCEQLDCHLQQQRPGLELIPVFLSVDDDDARLPHLSVNLTQQSALQRLKALRHRQLDVLLDTVGPSDSQWLCTAAQRVAALQLAWFEVPALLPSSSPYDGQIVDRWTESADHSDLHVPQVTLTGVRQVLPCQSQPAPRADHHSSARSTRICVFGSPAELLPGAATLLSRCLRELPIESVWFAHPDWQSPHQLKAWWREWAREELPPHVHPATGAVNSIYNDLNQDWIGLDLCWSTPTHALIRWLSEGWPVLSMASPLSSSTAAASVMSAMGLESFRFSNPDSFMDALEVLISDQEIYSQTAQHIRDNFNASLLIDLPLFARDLMAAVEACQLEATTAS